MTGIQVKLILTRLPDNAAWLLTQLIKPTRLSSVWCQDTYGPSKRLRYLRGEWLPQTSHTRISGCGTNWSQNHQSPKSAVVYAVPQGRHIYAVAQKVQTETWFWTTSKQRVKSDGWKGFWWGQSSQWLEGELIWNIVSNLNTNGEPKHLVSAAGWQTKTESKRPLRGKLAAAGRGRVAEEERRGVCSCAVITGEMWGLQTQQAFKQSWLHCGMRTNVSLVEKLKLLLTCQVRV